MIWLQNLVASLAGKKEEPMAIKDTQGNEITVTTEGTRILFWRPFQAFPFLSMEVDDAYYLACEVELAVESIDGV